MKSRSCFCCKKQGHLARDCPQKQSQIQETTIKSPTKKKGKQKQKQNEEKPLCYDTIIKQINACTMEERQKLLELFRKDEEEEDF